jgi:hypothetical protein
LGPCGTRERLHQEIRVKQWTRHRAPPERSEPCKLMALRTMPLGRICGQRQGDLLSMSERQWSKWPMDLWCPNPQTEEVAGFSLLGGSLRDQKGKPLAREGRKATGLPELAGPQRRCLDARSCGDALPQA